MSQPLRGQGIHLIFPMGLKNTNLVEDINIDNISGIIKSSSVGGLDPRPSLCLLIGTHLALGTQLAYNLPFQSTLMDVT